jgi:hypothetical protein
MPAHQEFLSGEPISPSASYASSPAERLLTMPPSLPREPHQAQVKDFCLPSQHVILPHPHLATERAAQ